MTEPADLFQTALARQRAGNFAVAGTLYCALLEAAPDHAPAMMQLALLRIRQERWGDAEALLRRVLALAPDSADARNALGGVLFRCDRFGDAEALFRDAIARRPDHAAAHDNLGAVLQVYGRFEEAAKHHREALSLAPGGPAAWCNLGNALRGQERLEEALSSYAEALRRTPGFALAEWNRALALLLGGDFAAGWRAYGWRTRTGTSRFPAFPWPVWDGAPPQGQRILVYGEQGVGDEIMFASCLPDLVAAGAEAVLVCEPRLAPLFSRSFPAVEVHGTRRGGSDDVAGIGAPDRWVPLGTLPLRFRSRPEDFPARTGFLAADPGKVRAWRARLVSELGDGLKVGIAWRGGRAGMERLHRSTPLALWAPLGRIAGTRLVNLQYGDCAEELRAARAECGLVVACFADVDPLADLKDQAALIRALDLVIAVDSAVVHLAGALDTPVWTLVPIPPDWRWMWRRADSPWYPAMRLYRQSVSGDWAEILVRVASDLEALARRA